MSSQMEEPKLINKKIVLKADIVKAWNSEAIHFQLVLAIKNSQFLALSVEGSHSLTQSSHFVSEHVSFDYTRNEVKVNHQHEETISLPYQKIDYDINLSFVKEEMAPYEWEEKYIYYTDSDDFDDILKDEEKVKQMIFELLDNLVNYNIPTITINTIKQYIEKSHPEIKVS